MSASRNLYDKASPGAATTSTTTAGVDGTVRAPASRLTIAVNVDGQKWGLILAAHCMVECLRILSPTPFSSRSRTDE